VTVDPLIDAVLRVSLAAMFAQAAIHKLRDPQAFEGTVEQYELLPRSIVRLAARAFPVVEVAVAVSLLVPGAHLSSSLAAASLLLAYTFAISANLLRGRRDVDCGCFGPAHRQPLREGLVARNVVLVVAALASGLPQATRALSWVDVVTLVAACLTSGLLWTAANQLLAQNARIAALRSPR